MDWRSATASTNSGLGRHGILILSPECLKCKVLRSLAWVLRRLSEAQFQRVYLCRFQLWVLSPCQGSLPKRIPSKALHPAVSLRPRRHCSWRCPLQQRHGQQRPAKKGKSQQHLASHRVSRKNAATFQRRCRRQAWPKSGAMSVNLGKDTVYLATMVLPAGAPACIPPHRNMISRFTSSGIINLSSMSSKHVRDQKVRSANTSSTWMGEKEPCRKSQRPSSDSTEKV